MSLDPNIILQAGKFAPIDPGTLMQQANTIKLGRLAALRAQNTQDALDRVKANPDDPNAVTQLAALDPAAGNAYLSAQAAKRAVSTRAATADVIRAYGGATPLNAVGAPAAPVPSAQPAAVPGAAVPAPSQNPAADGGHFLDHTAPVTQAVGAAVAAGHLSPTEAVAKLAESADPAQVEQVLGNLKTMDGLRLARLGEANDAIASAAQTALQQFPGAGDADKRRALIMQMAPQLSQHGITPDQLASQDYSVPGLSGRIGQALGVEGLIKQANESRKLDQTDAQQAETQRHNMVDENKPMTAQFGTTLVRPNGQVVYDPNGAAGGGDTSRLINSAAGGGQVPSSVQTLGQFVTFGKALNAQGAKSSAAGTYQITGSTMAQFAPKVLGPDWQNQPFNADSQEKVGEAIFDWAKSQPNPAAALRARWVSLSPAAAEQAVKGSWQQARGTIAAGESGGSPRSGAGGMSSDAIDLAAREGLAHGGVVPSGYARNKAAQAAITNRMAELSKGQDVGGIIQGGQTTKSQGAAFQTWNSGKPNTGAAQTRSIGVAVDHIDQLAQAANALGNGNTPIFNSVAQAYAKQTGQAAPTNFGAVKDFVLDEVTKAIIGAGGGVGDREKAAQIVGAWQSPAQSAGAIKQLHSLMAGQLHGLQSQYTQTTGRNDFQRYVSPRAAQVLGLTQRPQGTLSANRGTPADVQAILDKYR